MNLRFLWLLAVISVLASAPRLESCSCLESPPPRVELKQVSAVFLGVAMSSRGPNLWEHITFQFRVSHAWKGISTETVEVRIDSGIGSCGIPFEIGEEYLVYAYKLKSSSRRDGNPPRFLTGSCSRTMHFPNSRRDDLEQLGKPKWVNSRLKESLISDDLLRASREGDTERVKELLAAGQDVNGRDRRYGMTALRAAAAQGHADTVRALLAAGADATVTIAETTALDDAVQSGSVEVVRLLLAAGSRAGSMTLPTAAVKGHPDVVEALLAGGVPVLGEPGARAVLHAVQARNVVIARQLLGAGGDLGGARSGELALEIAATNGDTDLTRLLVANGVRPSPEALEAIRAGVERLIEETCPAPRPTPLPPTHRIPGVVPTWAVSPSAGAEEAEIAAADRRVRESCAPRKREALEILLADIEARKKSHGP